jgi:hypothetical protein
MKEKDFSDIQLTPTLHGNSPGYPYFEYFARRLPEDLPRELYEQGLSCYGYARLMVLDFGGPEKARIYMIERPDKTDPKYRLSHGYVIKIGMNEEELAYNNEDRYWGKYFTVGEVLAEGTDITEEIFSLQWSEL